jgi:hypothetical protein
MASKSRYPWEGRMAVDDMGIEERLDERMRREVAEIRSGMRTLLLAGVVLVLIYALGAFLIFH